MASGTLHSDALTYPAIEAQNNAPFEFDLIDQLELEFPSFIMSVSASRAATTDPWEITLLETEERSKLVFTGGTYTIKSDDMNWKSMADLDLKLHQRCANNQKWALSQAAFAPFGVADSSEASKLRWATTAELKADISLECDDCGNYAVMYEAGVMSLAGRTAYFHEADLLANMLAYIMADTTHTALYASTVACPRNLTEGEATFRTRMVWKKANGTDALTIGNYTLSKHKLRISAAAAGGYQPMHAERVLDDGSAIAIPSIQLDHLRRATKAGMDPTIDLEVLPGEGISSTMVWGILDQYNTMQDGPIAYVSVLSPEAVIEVSLDQANSLNILAAAAFAGLAGLASVGVAVELQNMLENSPLAPLFQNVAVSLGATTAGVITGYVSALVAAYTNGWITNSQLFSIQQHIAWIQGGYKMLALAAGSGAAISGVGGLLGYLGVSSNVVSTAIVAAGGATAGAGIALGMAAVMSKVVRHRYLGE